MFTRPWLASLRLTKDWEDRDQIVEAILKARLPAGDFLLSCPAILTIRPGVGGVTGSRGPLARLGLRFRIIAVVWRRFGRWDVVGLR